MASHKPGTRLKRSRQNCMVEWSFSSELEYSDPFNEVELSAVFEGPDGEEKTIPAFWAGGNIWRVRYASLRIGRHHFHTTCSDASNPDLHCQEGRLEVAAYKGKNPLFQHGPLRVSQDKKYLEHSDGKPFFWLGDTWWMGLTKRLRWPQDFKLLTEDRVRKGFTVIQFVAGLYPDMPPFDSRGANEAGYPWEKDYTRMNPIYFDMADRRIDFLVKNGLVPCLVGSWGYFMKLSGEEVIKKHWHNLVARYGAYPMIWCLAGEAPMPYYAFWGEKRFREQIPETRTQWTRVACYLRSIDPYHHPITVHPTSPDCSRNMVDDPSVVDIDMLQTGHSGVRSFADTVNKVVESVNRLPRIPVIVGEVCYEGIMGSSWEDIQRLVFWTSILNGTTGHTYGANGIWQINTKSKPFGPSPHGQSWGDTPWTEAYQFPGSRQVAIAKSLLERYSWWRFEPHVEWIEPHWSKEDYYNPHAAGIPQEVRIIYVPTLDRGLPKIKDMEAEVIYHAFYFDPRNGRQYKIDIVIPDEKGEWQPPKPPIIQDWILVMEAEDQDT